MIFEIGKKVKLKEDFITANSPYEMVVESINDAEISVFWFGDDSSKKEAKFNESFLEELNNEDYDSSVGAFFDDGLEDQNGSTVF